jgi:imidazolonepropionase-like amidohydrolase
MRPIIFKNANIWTGLDAQSVVGDVVVENERIKEVAPGGKRVRLAGAWEIDCTGQTLMPGLIEGHSHLSFGDIERTTDLGELPPEEHLLLTMRNARLLLDHGFTSVYSAASAKLRLDVVIRNEINLGRLQGPRMRAAGPEITVTGGLGDERLAHMDRSSFGIIADGADEVAKAVRLCIREGVDNVKVVISGDDTVGAKASMTVMSEAEILAAVVTAHAHGRRVNCHARSAEAVKRAVRCDVDVIYHCEYADEEALDLLESVKDRVFVGPAIGPIAGNTRDSDADSFNAAVEAYRKTYEQVRRRGIRTVIGGDYGIVPWAPQGHNARDIEHFVKLLGFSPSEALQCATRIGGQIMGMGHELGSIQQGYLADILLVAGDPLAGVSILQDVTKLRCIMKNGAFHKAPASVRTA